MACVARLSGPPAPVPAYLHVMHAQGIAQGGEGKASAAPARAHRQQMKRARPENDDIAGLIAAAAPSVAVFDLDSTLWDGNVEQVCSTHRLHWRLT